MAVDERQEDDTIDVLDSINHQQADLYIYGALVAGFLSFFLDFVVVSAPVVGDIAVAGTNFDVYYLGIICVLVGAGAVAIGRYAIAVASGIGLALSGVFTFVTMQSRIERMQAELAGNIFADAVSASVGIGVYALVVAGIAVVVLSAREVDMDELNIEDSE